MNGADFNATSSQLARPTDFFEYFTPSAELTRTQRSQVLAFTAAIDSYNNGLISPGHCSESSSKLHRRTAGIYLTVFFCAGNPSIPLSRREVFAKDDVQTYRAGEEKIGQQDLPAALAI